MELEQLINKNPQLNKITEELINQISIEKYSINLDYNKTLGDNGFDDLDCIEMVMEIEKRLDIYL
jgi:acyl carrier protein